MMTSQQVVYIGGYTPADQEGIHACTFDDTTGDLIVRASFAGIVNPSYLLVHPNGRWLYAVSETSQPEDGMSGGGPGVELHTRAVEDGADQSPG
jgi:6-phosphogluconolactonase